MKIENYIKTYAYDSLKALTFQVIDNIHFNPIYITIDMTSIIIDNMKIDDLRSYIKNLLRVYTPVDYIINGSTISIDLIIEDIKFKGIIVETPKWVLEDN